MGYEYLVAERTMISSGQSHEISGAAAITRILAASGVEVVFAYQGTSELQLCDSISAEPGLRLVNSRGDKEAVFMAGGGSLLSPSRGAALVHATRGLTNAAGGLAETLRDEAGTIILVGLPTTTSARYLPPHGERDLMEHMGAFAKWWCEFDAVPAQPDGRVAYAQQFVQKLVKAIKMSRSFPRGPVLVGIPQDVADRIWFPVSVLDEAPRAARSENGGASDDLDCARQAIAAMHRPVILVDDYVLRYDGIEAELHRFSQHLGAPVLQVRYRRGPMLFERIRREYVPAFAGWYDPWASEHRNLMAECDGLILLEDRNMYRRVVGGLPSARKVAISSDASKTVKNQILVSGDVLVEGNVLDLLRRIGSVRTTDAAEIHVSTVAAADDESCPDEIRAARRKLVATMAAAIVKAEAPVLVDDSQMFGGLIATQYDLLPPNLRIFGAHGGFVGAGIAYATGLAIAERRRKVFCTLGDQGFTNGLQGLVSAAEQNANVCFIVCNNGGSVSLLGQSKSEGLTDMETGPFLGNVTGFDYLGLARSLSIAAFGADLRGLPRLDRTEELAAALNVALGTNGPTVVELKLPPDPDFWQGIWLMKGFDGI